MTQTSSEDDNLDFEVEISGSKTVHHFPDQKELLVYGLFQQIGIAYSASDWRLFIVRSKQSLKAVLPHNENVFRLILVARAAQMKENQESVQILLELILYNNHNCDMSDDFKMIALLLRCYF